MDLFTKADVLLDIVGHYINSFESINGCCGDTYGNFNFKELFRSANPSIWNLVRVGIFSSKKSVQKSGITTGYAFIQRLL